MTNFFILGIHPALSLAELETRYTFKKTRLLGEVLLGDVEIGDPVEAMRTLGGTIKLGRLIARVKLTEVYDVLAAELEQADKSGKFNFGISVYGNSKINTHKLGLELKSVLKNKGISCRFVTSREKTLSSVVVEQNKLAKGGRELVLILEDGFVVIGITEAVQPFKQLSKRDYGRPARDDHSGMLPPKLAQIMINLSGCPHDGTILDPFCGSGTILTEAMLMGYQNILGSDLSAKAVEDSKKNIEWTQRQDSLKIDVRVQEVDARQLSRSYKPASVDAIVAETYLGPQRGKVDIKKITSELVALYTMVFKEVSIVLKPGSRAIIALPVFMEGRRQTLLPVRFAPLSQVKLPADLPRQGISERGTLIYGRPGQGVWREIVILQK